MVEIKETIYDLLERRHEIYIEITEEVFNRLDKNVFPALYKCLNLKEEQCEWHDLEIMHQTEVGGEELEFVLIINGSLVFKEGDRVVFPDGNTQVVDSNMAENFQQPLNFGVPLELIEYGTEEQISKFLITSIRKAIASNDAQSIILPENSPVAPMMQRSAREEGFDMNQLTDEQRAALSIYENQTGNTNEFNS